MKKVIILFITVICYLALSTCFFIKDEIITYEWLKFITFIGRVIVLTILGLSLHRFFTKALD